MTRIPKIYLETTIFNYYFDRRRNGHLETIELFEAIKRGEYDAYTSTATKGELERAPDPRRSDMNELLYDPDVNIKILETSLKIDLVAENYIAAKVVPKSHPVDATHIAFATCYRMDYLLSFNFKHINKPRIIQKIEMVNANLNLTSVIITTPGKL